MFRPCVLDGLTILCHQNLEEALPRVDSSIDIPQKSVYAQRESKLKASKYRSNCFGIAGFGKFYFHIFTSESKRTICHLLSCIMIAIITRQIMPKCEQLLHGFLTHTLASIREPPSNLK